MFSLLYFVFISSCPEGQRRLGATRCIDEDECEHPGLCQNGGTCINLSDRNHFRCICSSYWTGKHCTEPAPAGAVLVGGRDFIIVFVLCAASLLGELFGEELCVLLIILFDVNLSSLCFVS